MNNKIEHIILLSGGLGSFETARRVIEKYGKDKVYLWFFDTKIEDDDLYRFLADIEKVLDIEIDRYCDGRTPWDVFTDEKFIGNARTDLCSKHLKRLLLERLLREKYPNKNDIILYFGLDWSEQKRIDKLKPKWEQKGYHVDFPLLWEPRISTEDINNICNSLDLRIPRLYKLGFSHNNCGGACVKSGISQWRQLYEEFPERYQWHEEREERLRKELGKNISILRSRKGGKARPLPLRELREEIEKEK
jgi:3'-phosphoadenosine 5'-phosphosulfate sulfotransferase (PAPS reductase)/FAD synthetase